MVVPDASKNVERASLHQRRSPPPQTLDQTLHYPLASQAHHESASKAAQVQIYKMTGRITRAKSAMVFPTETSAEGASYTQSGSTPREVVLATHCPLLSLPVELRLQICSYITLSPVSHESIANRAILATCRQLQEAMFTEHGPAKDLDAYINAEERAWIGTLPSPLVVTLGQPLQSTRFGFVRNVTLQCPTAFMVGARCLEEVYSLYLDRVQIYLGAAPVHRIGVRSARKVTSAQDDESATPREEGSSQSEDSPSRRVEDIDDRITSSIRRSYTVKSLDPELFDHYVKKGKINCRCVTFTVPVLANADGGRHKSTTLDMFDEDARVSYTMTIVQNEIEAQVEREFISVNRFKPVAPSSGLD